jgi:uncharacterized protein (DUF302 family)
MSESVIAKSTSPAPLPWQYVARSVYGFDPTVARLKQAISEADLWLIGEIDPQMLLRKAGYTIGAARQLLFFHPRYMVRLLATDPAALPEVPLKFVVVEGADKDGPHVIVRHPDPVAAFDRYADLDALGRELSSICRDMLRTIES